MSVKVRRKKLSDGRQSLFLDIYFNGNRQREYLNIYLGKDKDQNKEAMRLADSIRAKTELAIKSDEYGFTPVFKRRMNFVEYFNQMAESKPETESAWRNAHLHLKAYTSGQIQFAHITEAWLEGFQAYLLSKVSTNTARLYYAKLKAALRQARRDKIILFNPVETVTNIKSTDVERDFLTFDEVKRLAASLCKNPEVKRAFLFCCYTGLRLSDVENLAWQNVNLPENKLQFRQKKTSGFEYLPLSPTARGLLTSTLGNVIPMPQTKVFNLPSRTSITRALVDWTKTAEIKKPITFHSSRHTFATLSLTQGVDLYTVSKLLGHRELSTTQIYAKIIDEKLNEAVSKLPSFEMSQ